MVYPRQHGGYTMKDSESDEKLQTAGQRVARLAVSRIFQDYQNAFTKATGLPLRLVADEFTWGQQNVRAKESPFCALLARSKTSCQACLAMQRQLEQDARLEPKTVKCFAGLCETAIPVRSGGHLIAFLETGHVLIERPTQQKFNSIARELIKWGAEIDLTKAEEAYFNSRVLSREQYESLIRLVSIFADHLASFSGQLALRASDAEPASVIKARKWIEENYADEVSLSSVARAVNVSAKYFSELFKQATGIAFVEYIGRVRVEKAKHLLADPSRRVSEIAFETGFQSLSQFNRTFRRVTGISPTQFRVGER